MDSFKGKIAVVTGGASGIGRGIARALAAEGAHVVVADVDEQGARDTAEDLLGQGVRSLAIRTDVRETASVTALAAATQKEFDGVDLLINNAGVYLPRFLGGLRDPRIGRHDGDLLQRVDGA